LNIRRGASHVLVGLIAVLVPYAIFDYQNQPRPHCVQTGDEDESGHTVVTLINESPYIPVAATGFSFIVTDKETLARLKCEETEYYAKSAKTAKSAQAKQYKDEPDLFTYGQWREDGYLQFSVSRRFDIGPGKSADVSVGIENDKWADGYITGILYLHFNEPGKTYRIEDVRLWVQPHTPADDKQTASRATGTIR
jgi:hypothetical protein